LTVKNPALAIASGEKDLTESGRSSGSSTLNSEHSDSAEPQWVNPVWSPDTDDFNFGGCPCPKICLS